MDPKTEAFEKKIDDTIAKFLPQDKQEKNRANAWLGTVAATFATGFYTYLIDWNQIARTGAHLFGAMAIPAGGAFASSVVLNGIEDITNFGINKYNKKHPENKKEPFEINPKVKNAIKLLSTAAVGIAYAYGTLGTEAVQFNNSGIFQWWQYAADIGGAAIGTAAFHKLDLVETTASGLEKIRIASKAITKPINAIEDKLKGNNKDKSTPVKSPLKVEEINISPNIENIKQSEAPAWDLSQYSENSTIKKTKAQPTTIENNSPSDDTKNIDDEINI